MAKVIEFYIPTNFRTLGSGFLSYNSEKLSTFVRWRRNRPRSFYGQRGFRHLVPRTNYSGGSADASNLAGTGRSRVPLDVKDVLLVDREAIKLLAFRESNGAELRNCPAYIRHWVTRERAA
jgi:hypothetical protein